MSADPAAGPKLLDHRYDDIQEYDNPLPGWWSLIYVATVIFSIGYAYYFHGGGPGKTEAQNYDAEFAAYQERRAAAAATEQVTEAQLAEAVANPDVVARGKELFTTLCVVCHGPAGGGLVGPNLTDLRQLHGSTRLDLYTTIRDGVAVKGMQAWGPVMPPADLVAAAAFTIQLRGKNVAGKAPEGAPVGPFEAAP